MWWNLDLSKTCADNRSMYHSQVQQQCRCYQGQGWQSNSQSFGPATFGCKDLPTSWFSEQAQGLQLGFIYLGSVNVCQNNEFCTTVRYLCVTLISLAQCLAHSIISVCLIGEDDDFYGKTVVLSGYSDSSGNQHYLKRISRKNALDCTTMYSYDFNHDFHVCSGLNNIGYMSCSGDTGGKQYFCLYDGRDCCT